MKKSFVGFCPRIMIPSVILLFVISCGGDWKSIESRISTYFDGSATLTWMPPNENVNGTPTVDLAGYVIYYGSSSKTYSNWVDVANVTSYTINNLAPGTYYFAMTSYDINGNESELSNEMSKTID